MNIEQKEVPCSSFLTARKPRRQCSPCHHADVFLCALWHRRHAPDPRRMDLWSLPPMPPILRWPQVATERYREHCVTERESFILGNYERGLTDPHENAKELDPGFEFMSEVPPSGLLSTYPRMIFFCDLFICFIFCDFLFVLFCLFIFISFYDFRLDSFQGENGERSVNAISRQKRLQEVEEEVRRVLGQTNAGEGPLPW